MTRPAGSTPTFPSTAGMCANRLADRMTRLGSVMSQAIVHPYGRDELLRQLSPPFWFRSFGAVLGMDGHSSGISQAPNDPGGLGPALLVTKRQNIEPVHHPAVDD